jgi:hypothetical protein
MVDDIAPGVISREATYQLQPHSDSFPGVISFESIRYGEFISFFQAIAPPVDQDGNL